MPKIFYLVLVIKIYFLHKNLQFTDRFAQILQSFRWCNDLAKKHCTLEIASPVLITHVLYLRHTAVDRNLIVHRATKPLLLLPFESRSSPDFVISICVKVRARETEDEIGEERREFSYACMCTHHVRENAHRWRWCIVNDDLVVHQEALALPRSLLFLLKKSNFAIPNN